MAIHRSLNAELGLVLVIADGPVRVIDVLEAVVTLGDDSAAEATNRRLIDLRNAELLLDDPRADEIAPLIARQVELVPTTRIAIVAHPGQHADHLPLLTAPAKAHAIATALFTDMPDAIDWLNSK